MYNKNYCPTKWYDFVRWLMSSLAYTTTFPPRPKTPFTYVVQSKLFITSLFVTEYSLSDINLQGTDLFPLKFPLYNRIFT